MGRKWGRIVAAVAGQRIVPARRSGAGGRPGAMQKTVSYTPSDLAVESRPPVTRRHVFYLPGYDPEARSRYRLLFVRELTLYAKRFGGGKREIGRASLSEDGLVQSWSVPAHAATGSAATHYDVLMWDDIVARDFARSRFVSLFLLFLGTGHALVRRKLFTFYRLNWKYGNVILYPFVMTLLLGAAALGVAVLVHAALGALAGASLPGWLTAAVGIAAGIGCVRAADVLLARIYFWQLVNDWVFNWQHGQGWRRDYESRLDAFADIVLARIEALRRSEQGLPDEILIVGHSSGALTAVEVAARVLARDARLGADGTTVSLATLGSGLPLVALQPQAERVRRDIAGIATSQRITWVDYVAPQDWLNFPGFNPIVDLDLGLPADAVVRNPIIRSARFRDIIDEATYRKVRFRPFRMHFQFLMANDRPGEYDIFAMTLGPQRLCERVTSALTEPSKPGSHACEPVAA